MMRTILSGLCLFVVAGFALAEEKKSDSTVTGHFKEWKNGQLVLLVGKKGEEKETNFKVSDTATISLRHDKTRMGQVPALVGQAMMLAHMPVTIGLDKEKNITFIALEVNAVVGRFKEWNDNRLTLLVGEKGKEKEMAFKIATDARVEVNQANGKRVALAKDTFKDLKDNDRVIVTLDKNDNISSITVDRR